MKYILSSVLRKLGLIRLSDKLRFYLNFIKTSNHRRKFREEYPSVKLPPAYFIYETFNLNYNSFYNKSIDTAKWLVIFFEKYKKTENSKVLDWGCGPGRVIRHLPSFLGKSCSFYGTDYNKKYINWCLKNIPNVTFKLNKLEPPLEFDNDTFDVIYGISIFTHLSKEMHYAWFKELVRVLKPGGILLLTLHGEVFRIKLTETERKIFDIGNLVVKANTKEGHRTYSAFQPNTFVEKLIDNNLILEHIPGILRDGIPQQDVWIIKKSV